MNRSAWHEVEFQQMSELANNNAVTKAKDVMARHIAALNAGKEEALAATLHFPHYRLSGGRLKIWHGPDEYLSDFRTRAGDGWHRSE